MSRRTAYRYFPTQEQLLTDAALECVQPRIEASFTAEASFRSIEEDPQRRVDAAVRAMQRQAHLNEGLLRTMIRLTVEQRADRSGGVTLAARGRQRIEWIESALAPVRSRLGETAFARLVSAVSLCVGAEALIVLHDIHGLDEMTATDVSAWSARALLRAALDEVLRPDPEA